MTIPEIPEEVFFGSSGNSGNAVPLFDADFGDYSEKARMGRDE